MGFIHRLTDFGTTQMSLVDNGDGTDTVTLRDNTPVTPGTPRFLRLRVEQE